MKRLFLAACAAVLCTAQSQAATLPRAQLTITSALEVNTTNHTVTLPLHRGRAGTTPVWYIITDASDAVTAKRLGVNYAPALRNIAGGMHVNALKKSGLPVFPAVPNFAPARTFVPSASGFPPKSAAPGGTATTYSPFIYNGGIWLDAPVVAVGAGAFDVTHHTNTEDRVIAIDTKKMTVTLALAQGFFDGKHVYYLSTEASDPIAASLERATYAPALSKAKDASIPIGVVVHGSPSASAPQGLAYLTLHTPISSDATAANAAKIGSPFNVLALAPALGKLYANSGYSPLWRPSIVAAPQSKRLTTFAQIAAISKPAPFVVNCPIVAYGGSGY